MSVGVECRRALFAEGMFCMLLQVAVGIHICPNSSNCTQTGIHFVVYKSYLNVVEFLKNKK